MQTSLQQRRRRQKQLVNNSIINRNGKAFPLECVIRGKASIFISGKGMGV
ncbi:hypothetical protein EV208_104107 [Christensenella hongkongensis]|nr:hypothetical protein EV208_104107 [Christensenella hongkongensis]